MKPVARGLRNPLATPFNMQETGFLAGKKCEKNFKGVF